MQAGMNANKSNDVLSGGGYILFFFSCIFWLVTMVLVAGMFLKKRDVKA